MNNEEIRFKGIVVRCRYNSDNFKIYVVDVNNEEYPEVKRNTEGKVIVVGDLPTLVSNVEYEFEGKREYNPKFGNQYKCSNIKQELPKDENSMRIFLENIIAKSYVDTLLDVYPNIVDKIVKDDLEDIDLSKLKGIKEKTFSDIKDKIIENYCLMGLVSKYGGVISMNMIKKLYDTYKSAALIEEKLKKSPYKALTHVSRIGFKTADEILLKLEENGKINFEEPLRNSKQRMVACYEFILQQNELNGNTLIGMKELREECGKLTPECVNYFVNCIKEDNKKVYVDMENKVVGLKSTKDKETYIYNTLKEMVNVENKWDIDVERYRSANSNELTDEQINTARMMADNTVGLLVGNGGTGKTASMMSIIRACDDYSISYELCSPTGKASKVLSNYTGKEAKTIHRLLKFNPENVEKYGVPFEFNKDNKLDTDFIIVDEASMIDVNLMYALLSAINIERTKMLIIGDDGQIPSVGCGNILHDLLHLKIIPINRLTKVFRYNQGGLSKVATDVRNGVKFINAIENGKKVLLGDNKDFIYIENYSPSEIINSIKYCYSNLLKTRTIDDIAIVVAQNTGEVGTIAINKVIQNLVHKNNNDIKVVFRGKDRFIVGDKVIQIRNNYKVPLYDNDGETTQVFNGHTGTIRNIFDDTIILEFNGELVVYNREMLKDIELGYCVTIHKMQGSQCQELIMVSPRQHTFMLNSNLIYTGVSRAEKRCFMIGNLTTINRAIKKRANMDRNTWAKFINNK